MLAKREPKIVELSKKALMLRGATASASSLQFVKDLVIELLLNKTIVKFFDIF